MTDYIIHGQTLTGIANAIRTKNPNVSGLVDPADMEQDILDIPSGGGEPYIPKEELVSKYDFTSNTPYYDEVREMSINTPSGFTHSTELGITISQTSAYMPTYFALSRGKYYRIEVEVGDYTLATSEVQSSSAMLNFSTSNPINEQASICWKKDTQRWAVYTSSGWKNASSDYGIDYFKNKKMIILYNCKYVNGQLVKYTDYPNYDYKYFNFYDGDYNLLIEDYESSAGTASTIGLGGINSYACKGSVFKSLKIYELNLDVDPSQDIIQPLSITKNGTYNADGVTVAGYSPVTVDVEPDLEDITITQNGNYKSSQHDGFNEVVVNVPPVEPTTKVVSEFDFALQSYDIARSIVGNSPSNSSLLYGAPYNASIVNDEMVFNTTGQSYFHPAYYLNELKNYEIEIEFGTVDNTQGGWELGGFKIYGQNFCVWLNYENNVLTAFNTSGNFQIPNRTLADFSNKTIKFIVSHRISSLTNETLTEVSLLFEGETTPIKLGDVDNKLPYYPYIGSLSGNAIRGINIKSFKITQSKWVIPENRELESEVE